MTRTIAFLLKVLIGVSLVLFPCAQNSFPQSHGPSGVLSGTVKSAEGKPLEGVGVSARGASDTFTTTVYTDESGKYYFPELSGGQYKIWAQACLLYTSDAADDLLCVDLGGRRIIK